MPGEFFDQNVNVFAGGDFSVAGEAAEAEGVLVALGNAAFNRSTAGTYNVGVVGVGSNVPPHPMSDMLIVGGNVTANSATTVDVGFSIGGNVVAGGTVDPAADIETNGGTITDEVPDATAAYDDLPALIAAKSAGWSALEATGEVEVTSFSITMTGDGTSDPQVFEIAGTDLGPASRSLQFLGVPDGAAVYVNVTGSTATFGINALLTTAGTVMDPFSDPDFVEITTHLMWNIGSATTVTVGGLAQLPGSIFVAQPASATTVSVPGTNGRVWVAGDLTHTGTGAEMHNYPFIPDEELDCQPLPGTTGSLSVQKLLDDPDGVVPDDREFTGTFACALDGDDVTPPENVWSVVADAPPEVIAQDLPVGAVCTLAEVVGEPPVPGYEWEPVLVSPESVEIEADAVIGFAVTNAYRAVATETPTEPTESPSESTVAPSDSETPSGDPTGSATPSPSPSSDDDGSGTLPDTGAPFGLRAVLVLGVSLVLSGCWLVWVGVRRPRSRTIAA